MANPHVHLDWRGDALVRRIDAVIPGVVDDVTDDAAKSARSSHPGWHDDTGRAVAGIHNVKAKAEQGKWVGAIAGDEPYFIFLEIGARGHAGDHTLRRARDKEFPKLTKRLHDKLDLRR